MHPKFELWWNTQMFRHFNACLGHHNFEMDFLDHLCLSLCVLQRGSQRHIKETTNIYQKNLRTNQPLNFLVKEFAVWRMSRNQFRMLQILHRKSIENFPTLKLHLLMPQNKYLGHQCGIWNIKDITIFLWCLWWRILFLSWRELKLRSSTLISRPGQSQGLL